MKPLATQDTAMNSLLVEGKLHRVVSIRDLGASCTGHNFECVSSAGEVAVNFCATTKKSTSRDLETVVNPHWKFYYIKFYFIFKAKNKAFSDRTNFLCFTLCLSFNVQKIAVLVNRSRINEKSQLTVNKRRRFARPQLNDPEVTRSTQDKNCWNNLDLECKQQPYKYRLKLAPTTSQSGESRTLYCKHIYIYIYIFLKVVKVITRTARWRLIIDVFVLPSLGLKIFMNLKILERPKSIWCIVESDDGSLNIIAWTCSLDLFSNHTSSQIERRQISFSIYNAAQNVSCLSVCSFTSIVPELYLLSFPYSLFSNCNFF